MAKQLQRQTQKLWLQMPLLLLLSVAVVSTDVPNKKLRQHNKGGGEEREMCEPSHPLKKTACLGTAAADARAEHKRTHQFNESLQIASESERDELQQAKQEPTTTNHHDDESRQQQRQQRKRKIARKRAAPGLSFVSSPAAGRALRVWARLHQLHRPLCAFAVASLPSCLAPLYAR